jgi:hypothetical protein
LNDLRDGLVKIPDYQRDSDQWAEPTKSLLVESVINNLSIPAFFFEVSLEGGVERNEVIDGQQRLTTLYDYFQGRFTLVDSDVSIDSMVEGQGRDGRGLARPISKSRPLCLMRALSCFMTCLNCWGLPARNCGIRLNEFFY